MPLPTASRLLAISALACLLCAPSAWALEGRVVDKATGKPMAGAEVSILGLPGVAYTDADGRFTWKPDPQPPFEVLVVLPGGRFMRPVLVEKLSTDGPLLIEASPLAEESVTVVGSAPSIESTPGAGRTTLSRGQLLDRHPISLADAVAPIAGVSTVSEGQAAAPAIRGLARGRTLILIDGARVTTERRAGASATYLDPFSLDSVEVSRGPGSVAYGSDAFGGVIFARTRRVEPGSPLRVRFQGSLGAGVPEQHAAAELSRGVAQGGLLVQATYRNGGDYGSPEGEVDNSGWSGGGILVRGEHVAGGGVLSAGWQSDFGRDIGRPRDNSRTVRFFYPVEDSHRLTVSYERNQPRVFEHVDVTGFFGRYTQITDQDRFATKTQPRGVERADVSAGDFQVRGKAESHAGPAKITLGLDVNGRFDLRALDIVEHYDLSGTLASSVENVSLDDAWRADVGFFGEVDAPLGGSLSAAAGLRADHVTTRNRGGYFGERSTGHSAASGFGSLTAALPRGFNLTGQVARGFRDPTLSDRYYRGPTGRGFITGNPELEPETSLQFDVGLRHTTPRVRWAFYAFAYRIRNLIERYQTQTDYFYFRNRGEARIRGAELEMQADLRGGFSAEVSGHLQRGVSVDDDQPLDDLSADTVRGALRRAFGAGFVEARVSVSAADTDTGPTEQAVGAHTLVDVSGGYKLSSHVELRAIGRNLLNQSYLLSPDPRAVLAPGASVFISALLSF